MAKEAKRLTGSENLCLAGGVALNCVANGKLLDSGLFKNVYIQPAAGDAGGAVGAILTAYYLYFGKDRIINKNTDPMKGAFLGPEYSDKEITEVLKKFKAKYQKQESFPLLARRIAELIEQGYVIGWFQGRMEFGPRALGNRSILGDARNKEMQKKLNLKIKYRESFRPFAPSVLQEDMEEYFNLTAKSPYMLFVAGLKNSRLKPVPENYKQMSLLDRLYTKRSDLPAITHIDFSARIQSVDKNTNPKFWELLSAFKKTTGYSVLVNTSFNVRGEPIVCTPEDAYRCFMRTEMDFLVMGNFLLSKAEQNEWIPEDHWKKDFILD
jgi:carbamoyltransferase